MSTSQLERVNNRQLEQTNSSQSEQMHTRQSDQMSNGQNIETLKAFTARVMAKYKDWLAASQAITNQ